MTYSQLHDGRSIDQDFEEYHKANLHVYEAFLAQAFRAINLGRKKISFKMIMNYLRWEVYLKTEDQQSTYKINDAYGSRYAEMFVNQYPQHADKVEMREKRSRNRKHGMQYGIALT